MKDRNSTGKCQPNPSIAVCSTTILYYLYQTDTKGAVKKQKKRLHPEKERKQPFCGIM